MDKLIRDMLAQGKSNQEIAQAVLAIKAEEREGLTALEIAQKISDLKEAEEVVASLKKFEDEKKKIESEKASKTDLDKKVSEMVDAKLKTIQIKPGGDKYGFDRELKRYNSKTGKIEPVIVGEEYSTFNNMFKAFFEKDEKSAKSMSHEIDRDNDKKDLNLFGKVTPSVSDVTTRGGFAIPTEVSDQIMQVLYEQSVMYAMANRDNVMYQSKVYPLMYGITVADIADQSTDVTESNPTLSNPTVTMQRAGAYSTISNTLIMQKGADFVNAFIQAYGAAFATYLDLRMAVGNVTYNSDLIDGIVFDTNTSLPTPIALANLSKTSLRDLKNTLAAAVNLKNVVFIGNRTVSDKIGELESTGGFPLFPGYLEGRGVAPYGIPLVTNPQIPSTLNVAGDRRTTGTSDVLICADMSKVILGVSGETRIDESSHFKFASDLLTLRAIKSWGQKVASSTSTAGIVAVALELTN